jgi:hypothetical protein
MSSRNLTQSRKDAEAQKNGEDVKNQKFSGLFAPLRLPCAFALNSGPLSF